MNEFYKAPKTESSPREFTIDELTPFWHKIVEAIKSAPTLDEYRDAENEREENESQFIAGESDVENLSEDTDIQPNEVIFPDFETLLAAFSANDVLSKFLPEEQLSELIEHEKAHLEAAKKLGYSTEIGLSIARTQDGGIMFSPFVSVSIDSKVMSEDEIRNHMQEIANAPGEDMSESDKRKSQIRNG